MSAQWLISGLLLTGMAVADNAFTVQIDEWTVPIRMESSGALTDEKPQAPAQRTRPRDPYVDSKGRVWFCGQAGDYIAYLVPETGAFKRYDVPEGSHPHNLIIDAEDQVWYAGNRNGHIGRLDPETGNIKKYAMPDGVSDPHTLIQDADGDIWFTAQFSNVIGRLDIDSGEVKTVRPSRERSRPYGIVLDSDDQPWVVLFGTNQVVSVVRESMTLNEYELPNANSRPRRIAVTSDDKVWYVDYSRGYLARLDPQSGKVEEWAAPGGDRALPYAMSVDDQDRLWFVESPDSKSRLVGFDSRSNSYVSVTPIPSGGLTVRHMAFHESTGTLWFGTDANTVGRARVGSDP